MFPDDEVDEEEDEEEYDEEDEDEYDEVRTVSFRSLLSFPCGPLGLLIAVFLHFVGRRGGSGV